MNDVSITPAGTGEKRAIKNLIVPCRVDRLHHSGKGPGPGVKRSGVISGPALPSLLSIVELFSDRFRREGDCERCRPARGGGSGKPDPGTPR